MITQAAKDEKEQASLTEQIKYCKEVIRAAARYERLMALKDFTDLLEDLKNLIKIHEQEINGWTTLTEGASFFKRMRLNDTILVHAIRKNQLNEAINYPAKIIAAAREAREGLALLTEEEKKHARNSN